MEASTEPDLAYFKSIPWCAELLEQPGLVIFPTNSRQFKESTEDALFAETLKTNDTIRACLSFHGKQGDANTCVEQASALLSLGYKVNGWPSVAHGGIIATIMDEIMGILIGVNQRLGFLSNRGSTMTAYLHVNYLKTVATPQTVLVSARFREITGRKIFIDASLQDGNGDVLDTAEALFVTSKQMGAEL